MYYFWSLMSGRDDALVKREGARGGAALNLVLSYEEGHLPVHVIGAGADTSAAPTLDVATAVVTVAAAAVVIVAVAIGVRF